MSVSGCATWLDFFLTRLRSFASSSSSSSKLIYFEMTVASRRRVSSTISKLIYQYELQTALYMLEPWEKALFNLVLFCTVSLSVMTVFQYTHVVLNMLTA
ncbi:hypothetical protein VTP01DRAFT_5424 [Rhizomucor pusillus]|uniref:uncharacterized protein n=1 Tax=Rhizomucor pusillus TaxID=4840 RepID=UPI0037430E94